LSDEVLAWLSVWNKEQMICIMLQLMPQSQEKCHCDVQQGWQVSAIIGLKRGLNLFKLSWQKQVSVTFLPKHNKCCNILDKSITFCRTDTNRTPFPKYSVRINVRNMLSSKDGFYTFVS